nr:hypothetical protein [Bacillus cereus]
MSCCNDGIEFDGWFFCLPLGCFTGFSRLALVCLGLGDCLCTLVLGDSALGVGAGLDT